MALVSAAVLCIFVLLATLQFGAISSSLAGERLAVLVGRTTALFAAAARIGVPLSNVRNAEAILERARRSDHAILAVHVLDRQGRIVHTTDASPLASIPSEVLQGIKNAGGGNWYLEAERTLFSGTDVTGTCNRVPEQVNIETIRMYHPGFHHLGMLWNRNEENSVLKRIEMANLADEMGFEFTALELPLDDAGEPRIEDTEPKVAALEEAGANFIYIGSSSFLVANHGAFTGAAVENGLPVLSPYESLVRESQALISIAAHYYDTGRLAGALGQKILVEKVRPSDLPVARMTDFAFVINMDVAAKLGF